VDGTIYSTQARFTRTGLVLTNVFEKDFRSIGQISGATDEALGSIA
jgi:hypothetical protein